MWISIKISLKFVPKGPINNIPALVQIMAWRRPGDKPLSEAVMVRLPTHISVTRPQWVYLSSMRFCGIHLTAISQEMLKIQYLSLKRVWKLLIQLMVVLWHHMVTEIWVNIGSGNGLFNVAWRHQAITWTNVDLSSVRSCGIHLGAISEERLEISILDLTLKNTNLKLQPHHPRANELRLQQHLTGAIELTHSYFLGFFLPLRLWYMMHVTTTI